MTITHDHDLFKGKKRELKSTFYHEIKYGNYIRTINILKLRRNFSEKVEEIFKKGRKTELFLFFFGNLCPVSNFLGVFLQQKIKVYKLLKPYKKIGKNTI